MQEAVLNANGARKPVSLKLRAEIQGYYPYYGATGQIDSLNDFTHEGEHVLIGEDGANLLSKTKDLAFIVEGQFWVNNHAHAVKCLADMPSKFVAGYVNSLDLTPYVTGSAQPKLTKGNLEKIPFPLPPLAEQKVIAEKLDKLLAKVDSIKARLDAVPDTLKRFRQSVLAAAVSGKLTKEWRGSNSMDSLNILPVRELLDTLDQGWSPKCINTPAESNNWGVIKTSSVQSGYFVCEENKALPENLEPRPNLSLMTGDILITRAGPRVRCGVTCLVEHSYPHLMICDKVYRLRVNKNKALPAFLNWCFNSPQYLKEIEGMKTGSSDSGMNMTQKKLKELELNVPPLLEQTEIVRRVEQLFAYADKVEAEVNAAQQRVNKLTQSILAKAFRGELTAKWREQNPDLISGDNSAEALLAKIKAEREKLKPNKKTHTRKKV